MFFPNVPGSGFTVTAKTRHNKGILEIDQVLRPDARHVVYKSLKLTNEQQVFSVYKDNPYFLQIDQGLDRADKANVIDVLSIVVIP